MPGGIRQSPRRRMVQLMRWGMAAVAAAMVATVSGSGAVSAAQSHQVTASTPVRDPVLLGPDDTRPAFDGWTLGAMPAWFAPDTTPVAATKPKHRSAIPPPTAPVVAALGESGIPEVALQAYVHAAHSVAVTNPSCHLDWSVLAAIGRVESNHGRFGGAQLRADGSGTKPIRGIPLDGRPGVARILDSDNGVFDGDPTFDRAVGPMQFLPSTWRFVAADGNNDGHADPNNIFDATLGAARYLCAGGGDLSDRAQLTAAVLRYNHSADYVALVLALAAAYHNGHTTLPAPGPVSPAPPVTTPVLPPVNVGPPPAVSDVDPTDTGTTETSTPSSSDPSTTHPATQDPSLPGTSAPGTPTETPPTTSPSSPSCPTGDPTSSPDPSASPDPSTSPSCPTDDPTTDDPTGDDPAGGDSSGSTTPSPSGSSTTTPPDDSGTTGTSPSGTTTTAPSGTDTPPADESGTPTETAESPTTSAGSTDPTGTATSTATSIPTDAPTPT